MGSRLYVGNLSWDTTEDTLRATFEGGGRSVKEVSIISDRDTGRPRGFAFVEMSNDQDAQSAIQDLDGTNLDGRNIREYDLLSLRQRMKNANMPRATLLPVTSERVRFAIEKARIEAEQSGQDPAAAAAAEEIAVAERIAEVERVGEAYNTMLQTHADRHPNVHVVDFDGRVLAISGPAPGAERVAFLPVDRPGITFGAAEGTVADGVFRLRIPVEVKPANAMGEPLVLDGLIMIDDDLDDPAYSFTRPLESR